MELPLRILDEAPAEPVIAVDGAWDTEGLHLSHWPGNRTPADLRHDLSTGAALAFARLEPAERARRAAGCVAIANNHYDTDGACAMFATRFPAAALAREGALLAAARAGDFFQLDDDRGFAIDAIVTALADPERSSVPELARGLEGPAKHEALVAWLAGALPGLLDGDLAAHRASWEPLLADARADLADLARCERTERPDLDLVAWTAPRGAASSRRHEPANGFDPGRHALFGAAPPDRVLVCAPRREGATFRLVLSTLSWFDLASRPPRPRPDLDALAERLNDAEGTRASEPVAWRAQSISGASPELWFGADELESYSEHSPALRPSALAPERVLAAVLDELERVAAA